MSASTSLESAPAIPNRWVAFTDDDSEPYWYCPATGDTTRSEPTDGEVISELQWATEEPSGADVVRAIGSPAHELSGDDDFESVIDGDDHYYYSASRNLSLWTRPKVNKKPTFVKDDVDRRSGTRTQPPGHTSFRLGRNRGEPLLRSPLSHPPEMAAPSPAAASTSTSPASLPSIVVEAAADAVEGRLPRRERVPVRRTGSHSARTQDGLYSARTQTANLDSVEEPQQLESRRPAPSNPVPPLMLSRRRRPPYPHPTLRRAETLPSDVQTVAVRAAPPAPPALDALARERDDLRAELLRIRAHLERETKQRQAAEDALAEALR